MSRLEKLGKNIRKNRELKKFSQEFLAEKVNLSREYITRIENGQKFISLRKLFQLADVLEVKLSDLMNFE